MAQYEVQETLRADPNQNPSFSLSVLSGAADKRIFVPGKTHGRKSCSDKQQIKHGGATYTWHVSLV